MPKNFVGESFIVAIISGIEKVWIRGGEYHDFPSEFLSHCIELFHWRTLWCFRKILSSKIFMHRRGASRFCRNFLSHRTETKSFVKEPFCFPEIFWYRQKLMDKRGHITISSQNFCLTVPKTFVRKCYCFWKNFWFQKKLWMKKGVSRFSVENFWSHSAKKFRGHALNVSENLGYRKILCIIGGTTSFRRNFFVSVPKNFVGIPSMFQKIWGIEKFYAY